MTPVTFRLGQFLHNIFCCCLQSTPGRMFNCASHFTLLTRRSTAHTLIFSLLTRPSMLLGSGPQNNNVKWGWYPVQGVIEKNITALAVGIGWVVVCWWIFFWVGRKYRGAKSPDEPFFVSSPEGSKICDSSKKQKFAKREKDNSLSSFLFEISAWLENQLMEQISEELKKYVKKFLPLPPVVDYSRVLNEIIN